MSIKKYKHILKNALMALCALLPFHLLRRIAARKVVVLNYHSLYKWDKDEKIRQNVYRTEEQFRQDLAFLKKHYNIISIGDLIAFQKEGQNLPPNALMLTFDDGLKVLYDSIYPILKKAQLPAVVFINPSFVDNRDMHYLRKKTILLGHVEQMNGELEALTRTEIGQRLRDKINQLQGITYAQKLVLYEVATVLGVDFVQLMKQNPLYLSADEIRHMIKGGMAFGAHSMDHPPFQELSIEDQYRQIKDSMDWVLKQFDLDYKVFAFPSNDRSMRKALFERVKSVVDLSFGVQGMMEDEFNFHFHRIEIEATGKPAVTAFKFEYLKWIILKCFGSSKVKRS